MLGRSAADGAKGLVEPGRSGDFGRLWTAVLLEAGVWRAWGISPTWGGQGVQKQQGAQLGHPLPKSGCRAGSLGKGEGNFQRKKFQAEVEERALELQLGSQSLGFPICEMDTISS